MTPIYQLLHVYHLLFAQRLVHTSAVAKVEPHRADVTVPVPPRWLIEFCSYRSFGKKLERPEYHSWSTFASRLFETIFRTDVCNGRGKCGFGGGGHFVLWRTQFRSDLPPTHPWLSSPNVGTGASVGREHYLPQHELVELYPWRYPATSCTGCLAVPSLPQSGTGCGCVGDVFTFSAISWSPRTTTTRPVVAQCQNKRPSSWAPPTQ